MKKPSIRFKVCEGAGKLPLRRFHQVGICTGCGVRTFLDDNDCVQPHKATGDDLRQFAVDGRKRVADSRIRPLWVTTAPDAPKRAVKKSA